MRLQDELEHARAAVASLTDEVVALRAAADASPRVDCVCPGCPRKVPQAWASGMCEPCCAEDCEHTDGALAVAQEALELRAEVEARRASEALLAASLKRADAENERLRAVNEQMRKDLLASERTSMSGNVEWHKAIRGEAAKAQAERDRLRAVLATTRENVETLVQAVGERYITQAAVCTILAAQRSMAGWTP